MFIVARAIFGVGEAFFFVRPSRRQRPGAARAAWRGDQRRVAVGLPRAGLRAVPGRGDPRAARDLHGGLDRGGGDRRGRRRSLACSCRRPRRSRCWPPRPPAAGRTRGPLFHPAGAAPGRPSSCRAPGAWRASWRSSRCTSGRIGMGAAGPLLAMYALIVVALRIVFVRLPDQVGAVPLSAFALVGSALGLAILGLVRQPGRRLPRAPPSSRPGIAFLFPALLAVAVSRGRRDRARQRRRDDDRLPRPLVRLAPAVLGLPGRLERATAGSWIVSAVIAARVRRARACAADPGPPPSREPA